ncbi:MAG: diphthine synthase [Candidatus Hydrothermarchaeaceae archaeon]
MLTLIGLGLHDEEDVTIKGLKEAKACDILFAEFYTSTMAGTLIERLEALIGKKISVLERSDLEEQSEKILEKAKAQKVGLLVPGDPLISTTHVHLRIEAKRMGIETRVIHNASIHSAAPSISGLQNYKFGRSATVAIPQEGFAPETPYDVIKENRERGLHTLLFLDIKVEGKNRVQMTGNEAIASLLDIEERRKEEVLTPDMLCVVLGNVGSDEPVMRAGALKELVDSDFGPTPHSLIVPGKLHFMEDEYLREFGVE